MADPSGPSPSPTPAASQETSTPDGDQNREPWGWFAAREELVLPVAVGIAILGVWELYGRLVGLDPLFFSYPSQIWQALIELARGPLLADLKVSGLEFGIGLAIATVGVPVGVVIGSSRRLRLALDPLINGLYATPILVLTPLLVIWFGIGVGSKIALVALMAFFPLVISTIEGVTTVDRSLIRAVRSFGARRWHVYRDVILPSVVPFIVGGLRLAIGRAVMGVVVGEFIAATAGIGYRIQAAAAVFDTARYLAGVAVLVAAAIILNVLLKKLEDHIAPWQTDSGTAPAL